MPLPAKSTVVPAAAVTSAAAGSTPFLTLAVVTLVVLKLTDVIAVSWWVVFLPYLLPFGLAVLALFVLAVVFVVMLLNDDTARRRRALRRSRSATKKGL